MKDATQFHIRPARPEEAGLFYTQHPAEDERLGVIGHIRMDFGRSGNEFWHTWWPRGPEELNSPVFKAELLEQLYQKFNCARPTDYHGHSLSVSDVIVLNQNGKISAHYVDSIGFKELPGFLDKKQERTSVLQTLKEKCDAPECNPSGCKKERSDHEL